MQEIMSEQLAEKIAKDQEIEIDNLSKAINNSMINESINEVDDDLQAAINASLQENELQRAINASLAENSGEPPSGSKVVGRIKHFVYF